MKIKQNKEVKVIDLPLQFEIGFDKVYSFYLKYATDSNKLHPYHSAARLMKSQFDKYPELANGFSDVSLLKKYEKEIESILRPLFPEALMTNEIKAASIPFSFTSFMFTSRFEGILNDAGEGFQLAVRNFDEKMYYIHASTMILAMVYNYPIDLKRPFFFDIPDKNGNIKNYRVAFNADLGEIVPTENAPKITEEDIKALLDNFDNIKMWKEKFPVNSYIFKGFGIMNLFDVTTDQAISDIKDDLLQSDDSLIKKLQKHVARFYNINDLILGISVFKDSLNSLNTVRIANSESLILNDCIEATCEGFFCDYISERVFKNKESIAISDVEKYGKLSNHNPFYKSLKDKEIGSIIIIPIQSKNNPDLILLEIASPRPYELNSINQHKLKDVIPVFESAVERASKEKQNRFEAIIQEFYTAIHPSVKWRFYDAADKYDKAILNGDENVKLDEIVFNDVYPLYGQSDIKGSSIARNEAIKEDLKVQLNLAIDILNQTLEVQDFPIYHELVFSINEYLKEIEDVLKAGDEVSILEFLKREIYPAFNHIKTITSHLAELIDDYTARLDNELQVIYERRREYERSVMLLNDKLTRFLDKKQEEAQEMFPHYFERYKTDGIEYNIYVGQSLVQDKAYENLYLFNLRLWQLQVMYEMENVAHTARIEMDHDLQIASLILVHSSPLAIKFRMDEKQFDVDGAYNIRYEIIKKRIDKAFIKNTTERLTAPGKISIVYSQNKDLKEYMTYIKYMQSKDYLGEIEQLELEDLQGVSGLKAIRVEVIYAADYDEASTVSIDELIEEIKA